MLSTPNDCKHIPTKVVTRIDDAWMGSRRSGSYEGERTYEDIICKHCGKHIKANRELTEWVDAN